MIRVWWLGLGLEMLWPCFLWLIDVDTGVLVQARAPDNAAVGLCSRTDVSLVVWCRLAKCVLVRCCGAWHPQIAGVAASLVRWSGRPPNGFFSEGASRRTPDRATV